MSFQLMAFSLFVVFTHFRMNCFLFSQQYLSLLSVVQCFDIFNAVEMILSIHKSKYISPFFMYKYIFIFFWSISIEFFFFFFWSFLSASIENTENENPKRKNVSTFTYENFYLNRVNLREWIVFGQFTFLHIYLCLKWWK